MYYRQNKNFVLKIFKIQIEIYIWNYIFVEITSHQIFRTLLCINDFHFKFFASIIFPFTFSRIFGVKCSRCGDRLLPHEMVMRAQQHVFHLPCFACVVCCQPLQKGEQFVLRAGQLFCRQDFEKEMYLMQQASSGDDDLLDENRWGLLFKITFLLIVITKLLDFKLSLIIKRKDTYIHQKGVCKITKNEMYSDDRIVFP